MQAAERSGVCNKRVAEGCLKGPKPFRKGASCSCETTLAPEHHLPVSRQRRMQRALIYLLLQLHWLMLRW